MVALYSPSFITPTSGLGGFTSFDVDPTIFPLEEDFNSPCFFPNDYHLHPHDHEHPYLSSLNLNPYSNCWDVDSQLIIPLSSAPTPNFSDPLPMPPCMGGGEGYAHLSPPAVSSGYSGGGTVGGPEDGSVAGDTKIKKQNHNASERMRRMKINDLYASLRALLPAVDHVKKLSIPCTVDRVVKYIPELQKEVQVLIQRKEQLLPAKTSVNFSSQAPPASNTATPATCSCSVQATQLGNGEISVQISTPKSHVNTLIPISEVLRELEEEDGLLVVDASSSESSAGRVFHHIHLMVQGSQKMMKCESLRETLLNRCQKWEELCLWMITQGL